MEKNVQLNAVYNGNQTIIEAGFGMVSNYIVPMLNRMRLEKILTTSACAVVQTILSHKHTAKNPFPARETIAEMLGIDIETVSKALKSIRKAGILNILKVIDEKTGLEKKNNMYDFKPFFAVLEKFIIEFKYNKNKDVKIADLMSIQVEKKECKRDFSAIKPAPSVAVQDAPQAVEEVPVVVLPEVISNTLNTLQINAEGIQAVQTAYTKLGAEVSAEMFVEKIVASKAKKNFTSYFTICIQNAYNNKEVVAPKSSGGRKVTREETKPEWFDKAQDAKRNPTKELTIEEMTFEQLLAKEEFVNDSLVKLPFAESLKEDKKLIDMCKLKFTKEGVQ